MPPEIFSCPGARSAELLAERRRARAVHRLAVDRQPSAHGTQDVLARRRNHPIGHRPDVQQVIPTLAHDVHELEGDVSRRLPVVVIGLVAPRVIDRGRHFPRVAGRLPGYDVIAVVCITGGAQPAAMSVAAEDARFSEPLRALGVIIPCVEPD